MNRISQSLFIAAISGAALGAANLAQARPSADDSLMPSSSDMKDGSGKMGDKHSCKGQNACKGHGGCKTDKHACKGQNACKGQGGCKAS